MTAEHPTPYPALNGLLLELVTSVKAILGDTFTGAYLQGSLAIGDFDEHSDIDFLVVIEEELDESQLSALQSMHARIYGLGGRYPPDCPTRTRVLEADHWETSLEGSYFPRRSLKRHDPVGGQQWFLDNGCRSLEWSDHDDTLVVRWTVRERGVILSGPDPKSLIDPIPVDALRHEILATMVIIENSMSEPFWNSGFGQPFAVMTYCRMLHTLATGTIQSKRAGVLWGHETLDRRWAGLIQRAWDSRGIGHVSQPPDAEDFKSTLEFIKYAMDESRRYFAGARA
jgi:hypothetical protein